MNKSIIKNIGQVAIASLLLVFLQALAFSEPGQAPPGGNMSAPLNIGGFDQVKSGGLWMNTLGVDGIAGIASLQAGNGLIGINVNGAPQSVLHVNGGDNVHPVRIDSSNNTNESVIEFRNLDDGDYWELGTDNLGAGYGNSQMHLHSAEGPGTFIFSQSGNFTISGKLTAPGGVDPPYVSFSNETHDSIRKFSKNVEAHEKVMQFWNSEKHRMEVYVIAEDKFYTIFGEPAD